MGNVDLEVAQVLEGAADLYESEQVEWCTLNWARVDDLPSKTEMAISMCAEGALMKAAGYTFDQILDFQRSKANEIFLASLNYAAYEKLCYARRFLRTAVGSYITSWNDSQDDKQVVIDTMRTVAKDIRNEATA